MRTTLLSVMPANPLSTSIFLPGGRTLIVPTGLFINGQFVPSTDGSEKDLEQV